MSIKIIFAIMCILVFIPPSSGEVEKKPDLKYVKLWDYNLDERANYDYFWTASNPSKYVMPSNPIIQYYANNTDEIQIDYKLDDEISFIA